jgi:hypothetical protein
MYVIYIYIVSAQGQRCGSEVGYDIGQGKQNSKKDKIKISCVDKELDFLSEGLYGMEGFS